MVFFLRLVDVGYGEVCSALGELHVDNGERSDTSCTVVWLWVIIVIRSIFDTTCIDISLSISLPFPLIILNILILPTTFNINLQPQLLIQLQHQTLLLLKLILKNLNLIQSNLTIIKTNRNKITFISKFNTLYF